MEASLKSVAQWVSPLGNHRAMQHFLRASGASGSEDVAGQFEKGCDRFAHLEVEDLGQCGPELAEAEACVAHGCQSVHSTSAGQQAEVQR